MIITREWLENELAGLEQQLAQLIMNVHRTEGAIQALQQMVQALDTGAVVNAAPAVTLDDFEKLLPKGFQVDREGPQHVDSIHPRFPGHTDPGAVLPDGDDHRD